MGSRGASSGGGRGATTKGLETISNSALADVKQEWARKVNVSPIMGNQSVKMGKTIDKNTEVGDKVALVDISSKGLTDKMNYHAEKTGKNEWTLKNGKGEIQDKKVESDGMVRYLSAIDYMHTTGKSEGHVSLQIMRKKKK